MTMMKRMTDLWQILFGRFRKREQRIVTVEHFNIILNFNAKIQNHVFRTSGIFSIEGAHIIKYGDSRKFSLHGINMNYSDRKEEIDYTFTVLLVKKKYDEVGEERIVIDSEVEEDGECLKYDFIDSVKDDRDHMVYHVFIKGKYAKCG